MRLIADTNVLVRAIVQDDARQAILAQDLLLSAEQVVLTPIALCELAWVLSRSYRLRGPEIASAIRTLAVSANVHIDSDALEAGLAILDAGGDFADGVIAFEGRRLGGEVFVSFDRRATQMLEARGQSTHLLDA